MKYMALALVAAFSFACSDTPMSPTVVGGASVDGLDMSPGQTSVGQKINLYFYPDNVLPKGNVHVTGLPVTVSAAGFTTATLLTDKQGSITFTLPRGDTEVTISTEAYQGYCAIANTTLTLPLYQRTGFIQLHYGC